MGNVNQRLYIALDELELDTICAAQTLQQTVTDMDAAVKLNAIATTLAGYTDGEKPVLHPDCVLTNIKNTKNIIHSSVHGLPRPYAVKPYEWPIPLKIAIESMAEQMGNLPTCAVLPRGENACALNRACISARKTKDHLQTIVDAGVERQQAKTGLSWLAYVVGRTLGINVSPTYTKVIKPFGHLHDELFYLDTLIEYLYMATKFSMHVEGINHFVYATYVPRDVDVTDSENQQINRRQSSAGLTDALHLD